MEIWDTISARYIEHYNYSFESLYVGPFVDWKNVDVLPKNFTDLQVCDLGCGCGSNAIFLSSLGAKVIGIDVSRKQIDYAIEIAKSRPDCEITFACYDLNTFRGEDYSNMFDLVCSFHVLPYIDNLSRIYSVVASMLRPQSDFVFSVMNPYLGLWNIDNEATNDYFTKIENCCKWPFPVEISQTYYSRPLSEYINAASGSGLYMERLVEVKPCYDAGNTVWNNEMLNNYGNNILYFPGTLVFS